MLGHRVGKSMQCVEVDFDSHLDLNAVWYRASKREDYPLKGIGILPGYQPFLVVQLKQAPISFSFCGRDCDFIADELDLPNILNAFV